MAWEVRTPVFEGPIDLLVHKINTHEVDVLDVPLQPVVDAFVAELAAAAESLPLDVVSEFLLMAAILVQLKSSALLPVPEEVEDDEELAGWDGRDVLLSRLLEGRAYAAAGEVFSVLVERASRSLPRLTGLDDGFVVHAPDLLQGVRPEQLAEAYRKAIAVRPEPQVDLTHVTVDRVTVAEAVQELARTLPRRGPTSFRELTAHLTTRIAVIVRFLALLELCKLGRVTLGQGRTFGELEVAWTGGEEPDAREADGPSVEVEVDAYDG